MGKLSVGVKVVVLMGDPTFLIELRSIPDIPDMHIGHVLSFLKQTMMWKQSM
jgi:hypothetical protein